MTRRVVLTGIGAVTPCGMGADALWQAALEGRTGVSAVNENDLPTIPIRSAGFIRDFEPAKVIANRKSLKVMCRDIQMAVVASYLARDHAALTADKMTPTRSGVCIGAGIFEHDPEELADSFRESTRPDATFDVINFGASGMGRLFPLWLLKYLPNMPACHITIAHNLQGPSNTITADGSGSMASIEESLRVIDRGTADLMFCGGSECRVYGAGLLRYDARNELSKATDGAPSDYPVFSDRSAGLVPGEGGTVLVLESLEHAQGRGAKPLAELAGFFSGGDFSDGSVKGLAERMAHSMREALRRSGLNPSEIDVVHVSARGIQAEDQAEASAINEIFGTAGEAKPRLAVTKGLTGFLGYSAAPVEVALAAMSLQAGRAVPSIMSGNNLLPSFKLTSAADNQPVRRILVNHFESGLAHQSIVLTAPGEARNA